MVIETKTTEELWIEFQDEYLSLKHQNVVWVKKEDYDLLLKTFHETTKWIQNHECLSDHDGNCLEDCECKDDSPQPDVVSEEESVDSNDKDCKSNTTLSDSNDVVGVQSPENGEPVEDTIFTCRDCKHEYTGSWFQHVCQEEDFK
jgi:hypothetical protein